MTPTKPTLAERLKPLSKDEIAAMIASGRYDINRLIATIEARDAGIKRLREAFRKFCAHTDDCYSPGDRCTCGFDEALAATAPDAGE